MNDQDFSGITVRAQSVGRSKPLIRTCLLVLFALSVNVPVEANDLAELAAEGTAILKNRCYGCHGERFNGSAQFNVLDTASLLAHGYVLPEASAESPMWQRIETNEMPPEDSAVPPLTAAEKETLRLWIEAGAPQVVRQQRPFKTYANVIQDIHTDLMHADRDDRSYYRYFTLTHLSNNYAHVTDFDLRLYRAAFVKTINSLSYESEIYLPTFVDAEQTIFRIDLRRLGWDFAAWKYLIQRYPYGVHYHHSADDRLAGFDEQIDELTGSHLCWMRADWFVNAASRPPIYDYFLKLPEYDHQLESRLNVNFHHNYQTNRLVRAGFATSGVSNGNRLVERHPALHGYYWKSYDFQDKGAGGNLFRRPLGPAFDQHDYPQLAFEHDGGEMIFSLPNGLQGYMLCDEHGRKIDRGPIAVVRDSKETSGTPEVLNGLSCMHCHRHGMIDFRDTVRNGIGVFGGAERKVRNIYPTPEEMNRFVNGDRNRFLSALEQCTAPYLKVGDDQNKDIREFAEPVGAVSRFFQRDLTPETVAFELGIDTPSRFQQQVEGNRQLIQLGLRPLANGHAIKRADWENRSAFVSPFQETARIMGLATPQN